MFIMLSKFCGYSLIAYFCTLELNYGIETNR